MSVLNAFIISQGVVNNKQPEKAEGSLVKFNKEQREGLAKVTDNLATACMIAAIVGGLVDAKIGWGTALFLFLMFAVLLFAGLALREEGVENGD